MTFCKEVVGHNIVGLYDFEANEWILLRLQNIENQRGSPKHTIVI